MSNALETARERVDGLRRLGEDVRRRVDPVKQMLLYKEEKCKASVGYTIKKLTHLLQELNTKTDETITRHRGDQTAELDRLVVDLDDLAQREIQVMMQIEQADDDAGWMETIFAEIEQIQSDYTDLKIRDRLHSMQNLDLNVHSSFYEVESALLKGELFYVRTCALVPADLQLVLLTQQPAVGFPVLIEVRANKSDARFGQLLSTRVNDSAGNNLAPMIEVMSATAARVTFIASAVGEHRLSVCLYTEHVANSPISLIIGSSAQFSNPFYDVSHHSIASSRHQTPSLPFQLMSNTDARSVPFAPPAPVRQSAPLLRGTDVYKAFNSQTAPHASPVVHNVLPDLSSGRIPSDSETDSDGPTPGANKFVDDDTDDVFHKPKVEQSASPKLPPARGRRRPKRSHCVVALREDTCEQQEEEEEEPQCGDPLNSSWDSQSSHSQSPLTSPERRPLESFGSPKLNLASMMLASGGKGIRGRLVHLLGRQNRSEPKEECFNQPLGCWADKNNGDFLVCDTMNNVVKIYARDGKPKNVVPKDWRPELHQPSVALPLGEKELLIKDDNGLFVYTRDGEKVYQLAALRRPIGLALDRAGRAVTLVGASKSIESAKIHVYDVQKCSLVAEYEFTPLNTMSPDERNKSKPRFLDVSGDILAVTDLGLQKVFIISLKDGRCMNSFGEYGVNPGQLTYASGIQIDPAGNLVIGDARGNRVQLFDQTGHFICQLMLDAPGAPYVSDIFLGDDGILMVSLRRRHAVAIYKLEAKK